MQSTNELAKKNLEYFIEFRDEQREANNAFLNTIVEVLENVKPKPKKPKPNKLRFPSHTRFLTKY